MPSILIVDDDAKHRVVVRHLIEKLHSGAKLDEYDAKVSGTPDHIPGIQSYDLVIMDTMVAGQDSLSWMESVIKHYEEAPVFIILSSIEDTSSAATVQLLVHAVKRGAHNFYFKKDLDLKSLIADISSVIKQASDKGKSGGAPNNETLMSHADAENLATEVGLAMEVVHGNKKWPFSMEAILAGKASLGEFKIVSFLGEDNTASTFKAKMPKVSAPIVVKLIDRVRMNGKMLPENFSKHFEIISDLRHPNLIRLYNYEIIRDRMVVAMEYLPGGTLAERLKESKLDEKDAIKFFRQLLEGIIVLHGLGLELHQLMPGQLMFRDRDTLVITHLGLINELHALAEITGGAWSSPDVTPVYSTPECAHRNPTGLYSDIYLAGLIGHEMLTGKPVYSGGSDQDILYAHAAQPMPSLPDRRHPMNSLLAGMLRKRPAKRTKSAKIALEELNKIYPPE